MFCFGYENRFGRVLVEVLDRVVLVEVLDRVSVCDGFVNDGEKSYHYHKFPRMLVSGLIHA